MSNCTTCLPIKPKCPSKVNTECVIYSGDYLGNLLVSNGDNLNTILSKIDSFVTGGGGMETPNTKTDTNSITISLSGANSRNISASLRVSATAGNKLSVGVSGAYVAPASFSQTYNDNTGVLSTTIDGTTINQTIISSSYTETVYGS